MISHVPNNRDRVVRRTAGALLSALVTVLMLLVSSALADDEDDGSLPLFEDLTIPTAQQLLGEPPRDWIVLKTGEVLFVEPLSPRPDTLGWLEFKIAEKRKERSGLTGEALDQYLRELDEFNYLHVSVPQVAEETEFRLPTRKIEEILHHEDLMLRRIDLLLDEGNLPVAYELLHRLERDRADWPGIPDRHNRLLFAEGEQLLEQGKTEFALIRLEQLYGRDAVHRGLKETLGTAIDRMIGTAIDSQRYRDARHYLARLREKWDDHEVVAARSSELEQLARKAVEEGTATFSSGDYRDALDRMERAAEIWPQLPELSCEYAAIARRHPRLHVGVVSLPNGEDRPEFLQTTADRRAESLQQARLFEPQRFSSGTMYYRSRIFDEWEPFDLGRGMRFQLRFTRQPWESLPLVDAQQIAATILERLDPDSPEYSERLAGYIEEITVHAPDSLTIRFQRVPPRVETLLAEIEIPTGTARSGGFEIAQADDERVIFRRTDAQPDGLSGYRLEEVVEHRYDSFERALRALEMGEVVMLPELPDWIVRRLQADRAFLSDYFVEPYAEPATHLIQFNPHSPAVQIRELRRALAYGIDRPRLLDEVVLRDSERTHGRLGVAPFAISSAAVNAQIFPREHDLSAAFALGLAARKQMGGEIPRLRLAVSSHPTEREVATQIVSQWNRIGLPVEIVPLESIDADAPHSGWDLIYRRMRMHEPITALWPFLTLSEEARVREIAFLPDWLRQELVTLDRTADWIRAIEGVQTLHRHLWAEVYFIPLWEVDEHMVVRKTVHGFPTPPVAPYHHAGRWTIDPWFSTVVP
ncbi:Bacterial extracellular solute-binding protein, family 5 Middle [Maioricimonas rarisocia]|uniref:Bacterial extracellular solute-binding protein, family 5 Middle n=1 Tax=Maioricimonas rarisocia TaxID=2528026 RepID=A0A517Z8S1_9PLAN|nr:ABC transporter substrate-binding protein [Maioricimonas rarisocia]QDU38863.1 Bacterial extracellular solute-binding protein, family 5 Middle [Maioricimonas rarisocia]